MEFIPRRFKEKNDYLLFFSDDAGEFFIEQLTWLFRKEGPKKEFNFFHQTLSLIDFLNCTMSMVDKATSGATAKIEVYQSIENLRTGKDDEIEIPPVKTVEYVNREQEMYVRLLYARQVSGIIWASLLYCSIQTEEEYRTGATVLKECLCELEHTEPDEFPKSILGEKLINSIQAIQDKMHNLSNPPIMTDEPALDEEEAERQLDSFINNPLYGQCYPGLVSAMTVYGPRNGIDFSTKDYVEIFRRASDAVNKVLSSRHPELQIGRIQTELVKDTLILRREGILYDRYYYVDALTIMVFLIALWDSIPMKSKLVMDAFLNFRNRIEYLEPIRNQYQRAPLWDLLCERIPNPGEETKAYLQTENESQRAQIGNLQETIKQLEEESQKIKQGWIVADGKIQKSSIQKLVQILHNVLGLPIPLVGEERKEFKRICMYVTGVKETTLDRLLSESALQKQHDDFVENVFKEFPILDGTRQI